MSAPQRRFRIAHILPWTAVGGTEVGTLRIAEAVPSAEFTSVMFCCRHSPPVSEFFAKNGFETVMYDSHDFLTGGLIGYIRGTLYLRREFKRRRIDLVHCADLRACEYSAVAAKMAGKRLVCHIRNRYEWLSRLQRICLLAVDKLIFVSKTTGQAFGKTARFRNYIVAPIETVVYDGLTLKASTDNLSANAEIWAEVKREFSIPQTAKVVGMVARISVQKDHMTLISAAEKVIAAYPNVRFLIIGECGPAKGELAHGEMLRRRLAGSSAEGHFIFTGLRFDVPRLLSSIDIFVLCTHFEGLPLVILEAMAYAKPVVATAVDGIPELVSEGVTGLLHEHENDQQLAQQLITLLTDEALAERLGSAGRITVERKFSQAQFAEAMTTQYYRILGKRDA